MTLKQSNVCNIFGNCLPEFMVDTNSYEYYVFIFIISYILSNYIMDKFKRKEQKIKISDADREYNKLIETVLKHGKFEEGRNGRVLEIFGYTMRFSLTDDSIPLITSKKVPIKTVIKELLFFIRGDTDNQNLKGANVNIWNENGSRDFLDSRGLTEYPDDILGPIYGFQWRDFNGDYDVNSPQAKTGGFDQLQSIIDQLKDPKQRNSRRMIMSAWNPCQIDKMALPPCHVMCQFKVHDNKLSCLLFQRSGDIALGVPFNIASYAALTHLLAFHCDLEAEELVHVIGSAHIYEDHIEPLKEQIKRKTYESPTLVFPTRKENINDYDINDFCIIDYKFQPSIKMKMVA